MLHENDAAQILCDICKNNYMRPSEVKEGKIELIAECDGILRPVRFISENHLSVRAAAAIMADRIFGDYC